MDPLIDLQDINKSYGDISVLNNLSLQIFPGEIVAVIGSSGSGKSTLIRCINGLEGIQSGKITIHGCSMTDNPQQARMMRKKIGMVFQEFNLFPHYNVLDNIIKPTIIANGADLEEAKSLGFSLLKKIRLEDKAFNYPSSLSGGQKQRVAIARALAMNPEIILFDEPTSSLDPELAYEVLDTIGLLASDGLTMVIVTHQINFISKLAHRIIFIDQGRICEEGTPRQVLVETKNERLQKFLLRLKETS